MVIKFVLALALGVFPWEKKVVFSDVKVGDKVEIVLVRGRVKLMFNGVVEKVESEGIFKVRCSLLGKKVMVEVVKGEDGGFRFVRRIN